MHSKAHLSRQITLKTSSITICTRNSEHKQHNLSKWRFLHHNISKSHSRSTKNCKIFSSSVTRPLTIFCDIWKLRFCVVFLAILCSAFIAWTFPAQRHQFVKSCHRSHCEWSINRNLMSFFQVTNFSEIFMI